MPVDIRDLIDKAQAKKVKAWLKVLGPPFISLTIVLCILGGSIAFSQGFFNLPSLLITLVALLCIHFGASCLNDYFDYLGGSDNINLTVTPYSGGSRVIQENLINPKTIFAAGIGLMLTGSAIGIFLTFLRGWPVLILGIIGMFLAIGYVEPHINLSRRGLGEAAVFLGFGPLIICGTYFVQARRFDIVPLFVGLVMGILAALVLWINEIPDYEADDKVGKKNLVVRLGKKASAKIFACLVPLAFILTCVGVLFEILPKISLLVFITLPIAVKAAVIALKRYNDVEKLLPANALTIALILTFGIILSFTFICS